MIIEIASTNIAKLTWQVRHGPQRLVNPPAIKLVVMAPR